MSHPLLQHRNEDRKGPVALSLVIHVVAIALIASITFRYPLAELFRPERSAPTGRIQYVTVRAAQHVAVGNGANTKLPPKKVVKPAPLLAPSTIPAALPPITPPAASTGAISGTATGTGGAPPGVATGVEPALTDPRIELRPNGLRLPLTIAQRNDSAVKAIYQAYREAEIQAEENRGRSPRDWTFQRNGQKYGLDSQYIYLGRFKLPSAILAALPFNYGGVDGARILQARNAAWIQDDIYTHAQGMSEDDFRAAVKRIRERKDKERREQDEKDKAAKAAPTVP